MVAENPFRTGNRPSSLAIARLCGLAPVLGAKSGVSRAGLVSSAVHASWSESPEAAELLVHLTEEEVAEIARWKRPTPLHLGNDNVIHYEVCHAEEYVCCDEHGFATATDEPYLNGGTVDFLTVVFVGGKKIAFIGDLKRTPFSSPDGPNGLQLAAYGFAACAMYDCDGYLPAFWYLEAGEWNVGDLVMMGTPQAKALWREVLIALRNKSNRGTTGDHCDSCWERAHCPEYLAFGLEGNSAMAKVLRGDKVTPDEAYEALMAAEAAKDAAKGVRGRLEAMVKNRELEIRNDKGKRWLPVIQSGRRSGPTVEKCEEIGRPDLIRQGADFEQMRWINGSK